MEERRIEARLAALERAVTDGEPMPELVDAAAATADATDRAQRLDDVEQRVAELEAATQALRGYVGNVRSVNEDVEERADAAFATVSELERRVQALEDDGSRGQSSPDRRRDDAGSKPEALGSGTEPRGPPGASSGEPAWLAAADDRLPESDGDCPTETDRDGDDGLAARLAGLL